MRKLLIMLLLAAAGPVQAQMSLHPGDGFEDCPHPALVNNTILSWGAIFAPFPEIGTALRRMPIPWSGQVAFGFIAPQAVYNRQFRVLPDAGVVGEALISMSRCPGTYPQQPAGCTSTVSATPTLDWTTDPAGSGCVLVPGQTYFFTITYGSATAAGSGEPWCSAPGACSVQVESTAQ